MRMSQAMYCNRDWDLRGAVTTIDLGWAGPVWALRTLGALERLVTDRLAGVGDGIDEHQVEHDDERKYKLRKYPKFEADLKSVCQTLSAMEESLIPSISSGEVGSRFETQSDIDLARQRRDEQWKAAYARYLLHSNCSHCHRHLSPQDWPGTASAAKGRRL